MRIVNQHLAIAIDTEDLLVVQKKSYVNFENLVFFFLVLSIGKIFPYFCHEINYSN